MVFKGGCAVFQTHPPVFYFAVIFVCTSCNHGEVNLT